MPRRTPEPSELYEPAQYGTYRLEVRHFDGGEGDAYRASMVLRGPQDGYTWSISNELGQNDVDVALAEIGTSEPETGRIAPALAEFTVERVIDAIERARLPRRDFIAWRVDGDDVGRVLRRAQGGLEIELRHNYEIELTRGGSTRGR